MAAEHPDVTEELEALITARTGGSLPVYVS